MSSQLERADFLLKHGKLDEAEKAVKLHLSEFPNDAFGISLFSRIAHAKDDNLGALAIIDSAVGIQPNESYYHYLRALYLYHLEKDVDAEEAIKNSIRISPEEADYFGLLATIKLYQKKYQEALDFANTGLSNDPENVFCLNTKSTALIKLGKEKEAFETVEGALNEDPEDSFTHANYGWGLLQAGDVAKALHHLKEALRLDPSNEHARSGMIEALKAKYWLYRKFLSYQFWMQQQSNKFQWGFIIGIYLVSKGLSSLARTNPDLSDLIYPFYYALVLAAFSTWVMDPISNLFLRLNKFGRFALNETETKISNLVGIAAGFCVLGIVFHLLMGGDFYIAIALYGFTMMVPLAGTFNGTKNEQKINLYAGGMAIIGLLTLFNIFQTGNFDSQLVTIYFFAFIGYQWLGNILGTGKY
jgi:tetratricopeptide (TPR) repeat protein